MEGAVNAKRSCSGLGVVEGSEAELAIGAKEVGNEGMSEIEAKAGVWWEREAQWLGGQCNGRSQIGGKGNESAKRHWQQGRDLEQWWSLMFVGRWSRWWSGVTVVANRGKEGSGQGGSRAKKEVMPKVANTT